MFLSTFTCFIFPSFSFFPSLSARVFPLLLFLSLLFSSHLHLLALLVAPGSAAINLLNDDATTHLFFTLFRSFSHTFFILSLSCTLSQYALSHSHDSYSLCFIARSPRSRSLSLAPHTRRSIFYMSLCVCVRSFLFSFVCVSV